MNIHNNEPVFPPALLSRYSEITGWSSAITPLQAPDLDRFYGLRPIAGCWRPLTRRDRPVPFPSVDPSQFQRSASVTHKLLAEAGKLVGHVAANPAFARQLMTSAQSGNHGEVDRLIKSTGVKAAIHTGYTPDGIHFDIPSSEEGNCCKLELTLRWGKAYP